MEESHYWNSRGNACELLNLKNVSPNVSGNYTTKLSPSTQSFATRHMNVAWTVCYGTTFIILIFLLILWYYFERKSAEAMGQ